MKYGKYIDTEIGSIYMEAEDGHITRLEFADEAKPNESCPLLDEAEKQLKEYFSGTRRAFDLPIKTEGTEFQQSVWAKLREIPYGETRTYGDIARQLGKPGAARAVGMANNRNPLCILIPCHRVVGADGALVGYAGGLDRKRFLLDLENRGSEHA